MNNSNSNNRFLRLYLNQHISLCTAKSIKIYIITLKAVHLAESSIYTAFYQYKLCVMAVHLTIMQFHTAPSMH